MCPLAVRSYIRRPKALTYSSSGGGAPRYKSLNPRRVPSTLRKAFASEKAEKY